MRSEQIYASASPLLSAFCWKTFLEDFAMWLTPSPHTLPLSLIISFGSGAVNVPLIPCDQSEITFWPVRVEPPPGQSEHRIFPSHCHWLWDGPDLLEEISRPFPGMWYYGFPLCPAAPFPAPSQSAWCRTSLSLLHFLQPINSLFLLSQLELVFCDFAAQKRPEALKCFRAHPSGLLWICTLILCSGRL